MKQPMNLFIRSIISVVILYINSGFHLSAQNQVNTELIYTTELETAFERKCNWANLIQTNFDILFKKNDTQNYGKLRINLITTIQTYAGTIVDDLQGFSNIREKDYLLSPFLVGYSYYFGGSEFFAGMRNINEDYFTTDYTSLFTQSSAGIHPTLSANYNLANYPYSGLSLFLETNPTNFIRLRTSIYNAAAGAVFVKDESPFVFSKKGFFLLQDCLLQNKIWKFNIGMMAQFKQKDNFQDLVLWGVLEKLLYSDSKLAVGILGEASYAFSKNVDCSTFMSAGLTISGLLGEKDKNICGAQFYYAKYRERSDLDIELTWRYQMNKYFTFQPAMHIVKTEKWHPAALLRFIVQI
ncbi:MAG: hypothetical protein ACRDD8_09220 [Bacteroidales bacterium]